MDRLASPHLAGDAGACLSRGDPPCCGRGKKAQSISRPISCRSPCPKCGACCGIWSGLDRLTTRPRAPGHAGAAATSSGPGKTTGNGELPLKHGCSTSRKKEWSRFPELPPSDAGCWCSRNKRRPYVSLIWCGIHRVIEMGSDLGSEPTAGELHEPLNLTP